MTDVRLGKHAYRHDPRTLRLGAYLDPGILPPAPSVVDVAGGVDSWPMYLNDRLGDCTCAAAGHMIEAWSHASSGATTKIADQDVVAAYGQVNQGVDQGAPELDVLRLWRTAGIGGHKIGAFAAVDYGNHEMVRDACWLFDGLYIGVLLPLAAQHMGSSWHVPGGRGADSEAGSWGGHAVDVVRVDRYGLTVVSWGELVRMSWGFWDRYVDECWAVLSTDALSGAGKTREGFALADLTADLAKIGKVAA